MFISRTCVVLRSSWHIDSLDTASNKITISINCILTIMRQVQLLTGALLCVSHDSVTFKTVLSSCKWTSVWAIYTLVIQGVLNVTVY